MRKTHCIYGQNSKGTTIVACGLIAANDGVIHVPRRKVTCKNCKKVISKK